MDTVRILKNLELSENEVKIYLAVLKMGPSPVRKVAEESGVNRGTTYDVLKALMEYGLVSFYHKDKKQYFVAEDPSRINDFIEQKQKKLKDVQSEVTKMIPVLKSIFDNAGSKPVVKYYEGDKGVETVLNDVISVMLEHKSDEYMVYSSATVRPLLYKRFKKFTDLRIKEKIKVRVIALGKGGEDIPEFAQRKWLVQKEETSNPNYVMIYGGKVAFISIDSAGQPVSVVIEASGIYETQLILFNHLWTTI